MKATMNGVEIEGTPEEVAALLRSMAPSGVGQSSDSHPTVPVNQLTEDVAFRALKRRPLSDEQATLLSLLRRNHPNWTSAKDLQKATKYNPNQLAGLLGAFGKRVASTEGHRSGTYFFEVKWDYDKDCYIYRLPDPSLAAVVRAGL
jgi:hypothetical protein